MRILEDENGNFYIDDEPMRITGKDAERILAEMEKPPTPEQIKQAEECEALYRNAVAKPGL